MISQSHVVSELQISGALWDLIQVVGESACHNTVLLMDRDNAEVFYGKISDLEDVFHCLDRQLQFVISVEQSYGIQIQRACELSNVCATIVCATMHYKNEHHMWYPPPEGLTPWYSQSIVCNGMWSIAFFMLQLLNETPGIDISANCDVYARLETLTEVLLEAHSAAITVRIERGEEHKGLLNKYWNRWDALLDSLYLQIRVSLAVHYHINIFFRSMFSFF